MDREQVLGKYRQMFDRDSNAAWVFLRKQDDRLRREGEKGVIETNEEYKTRRETTWRTKKQDGAADRKRLHDNPAGNSNGMYPHGTGFAYQSAKHKHGG